MAQLDSRALERSHLPSAAESEFPVPAERTRAVSNLTVDVHSLHHVNSPIRVLGYVEIIRLAPSLKLPAAQFCRRRRTVSKGACLIPLVTLHMHLSDVSVYSHDNVMERLPPIPVARCGPTNCIGECLLTRICNSVYMVVANLLATELGAEITNHRQNRRGL
jgi:hypothetical protein